MKAGLAAAVLTLVIAVSALNAGAQTAGGQTAETLDQTVQRVAQLLDAQDLASAKVTVDDALRSYPTSAALHNFAGVIDAQQGAFGAAESHFQAAIKLAPRSPAPYENLGRLYQEHSTDVPEARSKALQTYQTLITIDPANSEGLYQLAFLQALSGRFRESQAALGRLPQDVRSRPQSLAILVADLAGQGDPKTASTAAILEKHAELTAADVMAVLPAFDHAKDDRVAQGLLEALDRRGMGTPDVLQALGRLHARHGRFAESREILERAAASRVSVPLLMELAHVAFKGGDLDGALGFLAHARSLEPNNASVHFMFGIICVERDLSAEAYESLKKAIALDPENPRINYVLGAVATHRPDPSEAIPYFEKYVALEPDDPRGVFALGAAYFFSNQFDKARETLQKVATRKETAAGAHYYLARIARQANDLETARREVDAALQAYPQYADAWAERGLIETRTAHYQEAEQSLAKALALDKDNYQANVNLATLFSRTKDPRREAQVARLQELQEKRAAQAQEFLRIIRVEP